MIRLGFFAAVLALTIIDGAFFGVRFGSVVLVFVLLKIQANNAAEKFQKAQIEKYFHPEEPGVTVDYFAEIKIPKDLIQSPLPIEKYQNVEPLKQEPILPKITGQYHAPKFNGKPHEILGIEEDANEERIHASFRYWIKRYHPDHFGSDHMNKSTQEKARKLTEAKAVMLGKIKNSRFSQAA